MTPVERLVCQDVELSFLDSQMANSYRMAFKEASPERKEVIRRKQAEWFADYSRMREVAPLVGNYRTFLISAGCAAAATLVADV